MSCASNPRKQKLLRVILTLLIMACEVRSHSFNSSSTSSNTSWGEICMDPPYVQPTCGWMILLRSNPPLSNVTVYEAVVEMRKYGLEYFISNKSYNGNTPTTTSKFSLGSAIQGTFGNTAPTYLNFSWYCICSKTITTAVSWTTSSTSISGNACLAPPIMTESSSPTATAKVPEIWTSSTPDQSVAVVSTESGKLEAAGGSHAGLIAAIVVPVVVVVVSVAGAVVGFIFWRRRKQEQNRNGEQEVVKRSQNIYQTSDTRNMSPTEPVMSSQSNLSASHINNLVNVTYKTIPGITDNQYDVLRNQLPEEHPVLKDEQSCPSKLASPYVDDYEEGSYNTIEEDSAMGFSPNSNVYSYARNEEAMSSSVNSPNTNYNKIATPGANSLWHGESSCAPSEDEYNHIVSTDESRKKASHPAQKMDPTYNLARDGKTSGNNFDDYTLPNDDDEYNILCAADKQFSGFNGHEAVETYNHIAGDIHDEYDRIRQGGRNNVIGYDYDHVN